MSLEPEQERMLKKTNQSHHTTFSKVERISASFASEGFNAS